MHLVTQESQAHTFKTLQHLVMPAEPIAQGCNLTIATCIDK